MEDGMRNDFIPFEIKGGERVYISAGKIMVFFAKSPETTRIVLNGDREVWVEETLDDVRRKIWRELA